MKNRMKIIGGALGGLLALGVSSQASALVMTFEGLQDQEQILNYYNGGSGSLGSTSSENYHIGFDPGALALIDSDQGGSGNFANAPSGDTIAFWLSGSDLVMNAYDGFTTGFSFFYTSSTAATITVYDGLNGTGNVLGTFNLAAQYTDNGCTGDPTGTFCNWSPIGVAFSGTAHSVSFGGTANQTGFDNITIGSAVPESTVPEPASLALLGIGLVGLGVSRKRKRQAQ